MFPLGTTAVTFRFQDVSGIIGSAPASVTVILGRPAISGTVIAKGPYAPGVLWLDLRLTNTGSGHGRNLSIDRIVPRTISGTGQVTLAAPPPWPIETLDIGASTVVRLYLEVPPTVTRFSLTETGAIQNLAATSYSFSLAQAVIP